MKLTAPEMTKWILDNRLENDPETIKGFVDLDKKQQLEILIKMFNMSKGPRLKKQDKEEIAAAIFDWTMKYKYKHWLKETV